MRRPSWLLVAALLLVTATLSSGATALAGWLHTINSPLPPILQNLHGASWDAQTADFSTRLRQRYPPGTPEDALIGGLARDGFQPSWRRGIDRREAERRWSTLVCNMRASVTWRIDAERRITDLSGWYHEAGCL